MSKLWRESDGQDVLAVGLGGIGVAVAASPKPGFRALYSDGQDATPRKPATAPEPEVDADPMEQARIEAFTMGFEEGSRITAEGIEADQDAIARLGDALAQLAPASSGSLSTILSAAVIRLVEQIVGEVEIDTGLLLTRCEAVAAFIDESDSKNALHLNPDDLPLLEGTDLGVPIVADPGLRRGCVRLDTADGWIEDGPDVRLSRLRAMLDDMEGKL